MAGYSRLDHTGKKLGRQHDLEYRCQSAHKTSPANLLIQFFFCHDGVEWPLLPDAVSQKVFSNDNHLQQNLQPSRPYVTCPGAGVSILEYKRTHRRCSRTR